MVFLYNIGILLYGLIIRLVAPFNSKAKQFVRGRKQIFRQIAARIDPAEKHIWFHFASLGEFEQGRPVLEKIKAAHAGKKIVITFFSPSGYEIRKNYAGADGIFYLPLDTRRNAERFIQAINPELAIFTKYEFWHHYFNVLAEQKTPLFLISGIFRPDQIFFKFYGAFNRNILKHVEWFFVQNQQSVDLLKQLMLYNASIAGDTRFDRVAENAEHPTDLPLLRQFAAQHKVFIAGSTWPADEQLLQELAAEITDWKIILAPHEIGADHIRQIENLFPTALRYSALTAENAAAVSILIIDNIGMLSSLYQYARVAYIGGGFGVGIHNTLEAAAFGLPVIFGPNYRKFQEAHDLLRIGAAKSIEDEQSLITAFQLFKNNQKAAALAKEYVAQQKGATTSIYEKVKGYLD
jgi:3-deoxy-D-manno-octulosonic-acid transferase